MVRQKLGQEQERNLDPRAARLPEEPIDRLRGYACLGGELRWKRLVGNDGSNSFNLCPAQAQGFRPEPCYSSTRLVHLLRRRLISISLQNLSPALGRVVESRKEEQLPRCSIGAQGMRQVLLHLISEPAQPDSGLSQGHISRRFRIMPRSKHTQQAAQPIHDRQSAFQLIPRLKTVTWYVLEQGNLRTELLQQSQSDESTHMLGWPAGGQHLEELIANPFRRSGCQVGRGLLQQRKCLGVNSEVELGSQAHSPKSTDGVIHY